MTLATDSIASTCTGKAVVPSPVGPILLARTERGLAGLWFLDDQQHHPARVDAPERPDDPLLARAAAALAAYFAGDAGAFDGLPLDPVGSPFQLAVWEELRRIEPGRTTTYGAVAERVGRAGSARAVGSAVGRNPLGIVVPCHRVVGADGSLTGYAGGLERKRALLRIEAEGRSARDGLPAAIASGG